MMLDRKELDWGDIDCKLPLFDHLDRSEVSSFILILCKYQADLKYGLEPNLP